MIHDCFLTAFQLVCETARLRLSREEVQKQLCSVLVAAFEYLRRDATTLVAQDSYLLAVKRAESVAAIVGMVFEGENEPNSSSAAEDYGNIEGSKQGGAIDTSVKCLVGLQTTLKRVYAAAKNDISVTTEQKQTCAELAPNAVVHVSRQPLPSLLPKAH